MVGKKVRPVFPLAIGSFYDDFAAAVDGLEVRSAPAARIERKEIGSFGNSFIKDDFSKGDVGF